VASRVVLCSIELCQISTVNQTQIMYKSLPYIYCKYHTNYVYLNSIFISEVAVKEGTGIVSITPFGVR
jgi:hypothetical protein